MTNDALQTRLASLRPRLLGIGVVGVLLAIGLAFLLHGLDWFLRAYLVAYMFCLYFTVGSLALLMLHHMVGGYWGWVIRRPLEAAGRNVFPLMVVLFVPILAFLPRLYGWANQATYAANTAYQAKHWYLNTPFFVTRAVFYFICWGILAYLLSRWSAEQDESGQPPVGKFRSLSAPGLVIFGLTITFASVDWVMSLESYFFSTIYGMIFMVIPALCATCFMIVTLTRLSKYSPLSFIAGPNQFHDLGNIFFVFTMLWAYLSFDQFLIIWAGNLQDEAPWYMSRSKGGWGWVAMFLIIFHFFLPFFLLLLRDIKRRARLLSKVAVAMLVFELVDTYWLIVPAFATRLSQVPMLHFVLTLLVVIGVGSIWLWRFLAQLARMPVLPQHDPRFLEAPFAPETHMPELMGRANTAAPFETTSNAGPRLSSTR
jgi:hypothetical protein